MLVGQEANRGGCGPRSASLKSSILGDSQWKKRVVKGNYKIIQGCQKI